jgi:hypothetical protein
VALVTGSGVHAWWTKSDSVPVAPIRQPDAIAPVKPAEIDESRSHVTRNNVTLTDNEAKAIIAAVKLGDGSYVVSSFPVGSKPVVKTLVVGSGPEPLRPSLPKPGPEPTTPSEPAPSAVTMVVYIYEKDQGGVPSQVMAGLNKVNRDSGFKIKAVTHEHDSKNGKSDIPKEYKPAMSESEKTGLPVLVVLAGDKVFRSIKDPKTVEAVTGAVQ